MGTNLNLKNGSPTVSLQYIFYFSIHIIIRINHIMKPQFNPRELGVGLSELKFDLKNSSFIYFPVKIYLTLALPPCSIPQPGLSRFYRFD